MEATMKRTKEIFTQVRNALEDSMYDVLPKLLPGGRFKGWEYVCGSLLGGPGDSCTTNSISGIGYDSATGERWGDIIDLARQVWKIPPLEAAERLALMCQLWIVLKIQKYKKKTPEPVFRPAGAAPLDVPVFPVPGEAPPHPDRHYRHGTPTAMRCYRDQHGNVLHYVAQFQSSRMEKKIIPLAFFRNIKTGNCRWLWRELPSPRPLYNLDKLAAKPKAHVLLVQDEKTADAAGMLFPEFVCMAWSGGSAMGRIADATPIDKRFVHIWPENSVYGFRGAILIAETMLQSYHSAGILLPPKTLPEKWNLSDKAPDGFNPRDFMLSREYMLTEFLKAAIKRYPSLRNMPTAKSYRVAYREDTACFNPY
jgi:hypothetical protein